MRKPAAPSVDAYLAALPAAQRAPVATVRDVVRKHLPRGYEETMRGRMICYEVPLSTYATTYNGDPLCYAGIMTHKNYSTLYLMAAYGDPQRAGRLRDGFKEAGKRLDMGKSCIRFKSADDLALEVIGEVVASVPVDAYVAVAERARARPRAKRRA